MSLRSSEQPHTHLLDQDMATAVQKYFAESYRQKFMAAFPELTALLTDDGIRDIEITDGIQHLKEACAVLVY